MKNLSIVFILLIAYGFSIEHIKTANLQQVSNEICIQKTIITRTKSITPPTLPKKSLVITKQRRLKSYQSNHRIARKRKAVPPTHSIAGID